MGSILNWITGGVLKEVKDGLLQAQRNHLESQTQASEQDLKFWQSRMDLAVAAAQYDKWWSPRNLMGTAVAIYVLKLVLYDTVLGWGVTQYPGEQVTFIVMTVVGFYFASKAAENIASILSSRIAK